MTRIVAIKFQEAGRQYHFNAQGLELKAGDRVIVETDRGRAMATVVQSPREVADSDAPEGLKSIQRIATDEDMAMSERNAAREHEAKRFCAERIKARNMEMKLVRAEYAFDGSKIIFFFTADGRIDFRELVKDLAHHFHTRIEMRQIGVRDEAKQVGGIGICCRELCCSTFLTQFSPVSVKMAKEQGLALNPAKISGQCGRLLCCLGYEFETYKELKKGMPKCGKKVTWQNSECDVVSLDVLRQQVTLRDGQGSCCCVTMEELRSGQSHQQTAEKPGGDAITGRLNKGGRQQEKPSRQEQPPREKKAAKPAEGTATPVGAEAEEKQDQPDKKKSPSKRRRRGRRRPRGGGKPTPGKQGD